MLWPCSMRNEPPVSVCRQPHQHVGARLTGIQHDLAEVPVIGWAELVLNDYLPTSVVLSQCRLS